MDNRNKSVGPSRFLSWAVREQMVKEYLSGNYTKAEIWRKYTGAKTETGQILRWIKKLGYLSEERSKYPANFSSKPPKLLENSHDQKDSWAMERRIKELEESLKMAEVRAEGLELMIEVAEDEWKIPIRKKSDTK